MTAILQTTFSLQISLKIVPRVSINNIAALVHIMACLRPGSKTLTEPIMDDLRMHVWPR